MSSLLLDQLVIPYSSSLPLAPFSFNSFFVALLRNSWPFWSTLPVHPSNSYPTVLLPTITIHYPSFLGFLPSFQPRISSQIYILYPLSFIFLILTVAYFIGTVGHSGSLFLLSYTDLFQPIHNLTFLHFLALLHSYLPQVLSQTYIFYPLPL